MKWDKEGDANSRFYFPVNERRRRSLIKELEGEDVEVSLILDREIRKLYKILFAERRWSIDLVLMS